MQGDSLSLVEFVMDAGAEFGAAEGEYATLGDLHTALCRSSPERPPAEIWAWMENRLLGLGVPRDRIARATQLDALQD